MKILCVARNYALHAREMKAEAPASPVFFLKPDSAILHDNQPFFYPDFSRQVEHEVELVVKIDRVGKSIEPRFAHRYYSEVTLGIDFTARDLQQEAKAKGLPWLQSKGFDGSAAIGRFVPLKELNAEVQNLGFALFRNGTMVQQGNTRDMIHTVDLLISDISRYMLLRTGDLIFTGTPAGVGPVEIGDTLVAELQGHQLLECRIR